MHKICSNMSIFAVLTCPILPHRPLPPRLLLLPPRRLLPLRMILSSDSTMRRRSTRRVKLQQKRFVAIPLYYHFLIDTTLIFVVLFKGCQWCPCRENGHCSSTEGGERGCWRKSEEGKGQSCREVSCRAWSQALGRYLNYIVTWLKCEITQY